MFKYHARLHKRQTNQNRRSESKKQRVVLDFEPSKSKAALSAEVATLVDLVFQARLFEHCKAF